MDWRRMLRPVRLSRARPFHAAALGLSVRYRWSSHQSSRSKSLSIGAPRTRMVVPSKTIVLGSSGLGTSLLTRSSGRRLRRPRRRISRSVSFSFMLVPCHTSTSCVPTAKVSFAFCTCTGWARRRYAIREDAASYGHCYTRLDAYSTGAASVYSC